MDIRLYFGNLSFNVTEAELRALLNNWPTFLPIYSDGPGNW